MAITFADLRLNAITKLKSCPPQVINQRLYWAAQDFLRQTEVWKYGQNQDIIAFQDAYILTLPTSNSEIKRLSGAWYGSNSQNKSGADRIDTDEYEYRVDKSVVAITDGGGADADVLGSYQTTGQSYNAKPLYRYKTSSTEFFLWWQSSSSQWILSAEAGSATDAYIGTGGTIAGTYNGTGTYAGGDVTGTDASGPAIDFIEAFTADLEFGLYTEIVLIPDLENADEVPDELMDEWGIRGFMEMALWDLKNDADQPWEDAEGAKRHGRRMDKAIEEAKRQSFTKRKSGDLRVIPRYFA